MNTEQLDPDNHESKDLFLYFLTNNTGFNVEICHSYKRQDDTLGFSKWISYMELSHYNENEYVPKAKMTRSQFIQKASHRSILDIEIVIDIDEPGNYNSIKEKTKGICYMLQKKHAEFLLYWTGSKSYHLHIFIPELRKLSKYQRQKRKERMLKELGADIQKSTERCMIAFERQPHYKSGKPKERVLKWETL